MTTLVTGAAGFLGSALTRRLAGRGEAVRGLDLPRARWDRIAQTDAEQLRGDITRPADVDLAMRGVGRVFHVAALYELGTKDPARMRAINVGGTENVVRAAKEHDVPLVYVSTVAALGPTGERLASESHWAGAAPRSAYEATKREAHELVRAAAAAGAKIRIGMPATIYGAGDPSMIGKVHGWLARGALRVGVRGSMKLCFVHVDDCADALVRIADAGKDGEEYILSADVVTLRAWFEAFARMSGRAPPRMYLPDWLVDASGAAASRIRSQRGPFPLLREAAAMSDRVHWAFSGEKMRRELGWAPRSFDAGLAEVAHALGRRETPKPSPASV